MTDSRNMSLFLSLFALTLPHLLHAHSFFATISFLSVPSSFNYVVHSLAPSLGEKSTEVFDVISFQSSRCLGQSEGRSQRAASVASATKRPFSKPCTLSKLCFTLTTHQMNNKFTVVKLQHSPLSSFLFFSLS